MSPTVAADLLTLSYHSDLNIFVGRWGYQPTLEQLPEAYALLRRQTVALGSRFWLQDIRRRVFNDPATTH
ncbi:hypothetical protein E5K00_12975 [Hymenobacter aquaticus]|uniref:Uncharacterized protein n=1 Tax=Hymenobacter aquaticus TaxID=1867101 RepID=A0A4Z0PVA0_9BACT|nr:hypothetical protein [Hymenobacter aquaticus]TGE21204.1 hypothetical protein E5K00_12975 [Hymenobacter aquaticus]